MHKCTILTIITPDIEGICNCILYMWTDKPVVTNEARVDHEDLLTVLTHLLLLFMANSI